MGSYHLIITDFLFCNQRFGNYMYTKLCIYVYNCIKSTFCTPSIQFTRSVQFSSVAHWCLTLCDPMNRITPGFPVHHQPPEFTQTHIHRVSDAIQPSQPLSSPSPPALNLPLMPILKNLWLGRELRF